MRYERSVMTAPRDALRRIVGCAGCAGHQRPGYIREWGADPTSPNGARWVWKRCPDGCTAESRQASVDRQLAARLGRPVGTATDPAASAGTSAEPAPESAPAVPAAVAQDKPRASSSRRPGAPRAARPERERPELVAAVAVDVDDTGRLVVDVDSIGAPEGKTLKHLFAWLASRLPIGAERLHRDGRRANGVVCLSAAAARALRLPAALPEGSALAKLETRIRTAAQEAGMTLGQNIGPRMRAFETEAPKRGAKVSVGLVVVPWLGSGDVAKQITADYTLRLAATVGGELDARTLARRMRAFTADIGLPPVATAAVTSRDLVDALRPRSVWGEDRRRTVKDDALPAGDLAVPVAAGVRHPLTLAEMAAHRPVCVEEDYKWVRERTGAEAAMPWAVAVDVSASYLSVTETLPLPAGRLVHTDAPAFERRTAGLWLCDFTGLETEAELPHPATYDGKAPTGPGWYATPTVDYMAKTYGFDPATIGEAYVSERTEAFLRQWTETVRGAYKRQLAVLGLVDGMDPAAFLAAHAARKEDQGEDARADAAALVATYQDIYKKGIGRWAYNGGDVSDAEWLEKVAAHWSYRPEVRFHVIAAARIATHRRMRKTYQLTGRAPFAVNVDSMLYACEEPGPLPLIPHGEDGRPVPGALRLGTAPGSVKHEKTIPMQDITEHAATGAPLKALTKHYGPSGRITKEV